MRSRLLLNLFLVFTIALVHAGCAKKVPPSLGLPFNLSSMFEGKPAARDKSWKEKGILLVKEGNVPGAIDAFIQHVLEGPEDYSGFNAIAICYRRLGNHAEAAKNFERALELAVSPEDRAKVLANLGDLYLSADKPQTALGFFKEATALAEKNPLYRIFIAKSFLSLGDEDRARKVLASAEELEPELPKWESDDDRGLGSYVMARCYLSLRDETKVLHHLENAIKRNPGKYVPLIRRELTDTTSLLFSLKGNPKLEKALRAGKRDAGAREHDSGFRAPAATGRARTGNR